MTAKYFAILTNQGAARLANATALGTKLNLTQMTVGDANGALPVPDPAQTRLINPKRMAPLNLLSVDPNNASQIIAEQIIPEDVGGFWIREIGLYDDEGVLIAVANCPETYKPQLQEGSGRTQTIRMILIVSSTTAITLKIDPSVVLATRKYLDDKVIEVKLYADNLMKAHTSAADPHPQYAPKASPVFTGSPKAPTPAQADNSTLLATTAYVKTALAGLVGSAPAALDTLNELAAALGNDPKFATTMLNALAGKQPLDTTLNALSGKSVAALLEYLGLGEAAKRNVGTGINQIPDMASFAISLANPGWARLPNGLMLQWGTTPQGNTVRATTFAIPFPTGIIFVNHFDAGWSSASNGSKWGATNKTLAGFTANTDTAGEGGSYFALGY
ncbi:phage tail protein [Enterobacter sp.]|uniref:phage tail protein n=2 Tax=Enterobacter sp. TaxID=42895 RepID=UPI0029700190|nr:phage tail protein [Enterobacter sp.]